MTAGKARGGIVVTGASTGIGRDAAERLSGMGYTVFAGVRKAKDADDVRKRGLEPLLIDVTSPEQVAAAPAAVAAALDGAPLVGLVNNAGVAGGGPLEFVDLDDVRSVFEVNVFGLLAATQAFMPMLRTGRGRIVNIGSIAGKVASPFLGPYAASKHAVEAFSDAMRRELAPWNMHVSLIEPGAVATPIWDKGNETLDELVGGDDDGQIQALYGKAIAKQGKIIHANKKRGIDPRYVSDAVVHALTHARPRTRYLVGKDARAGAVIQGTMPDRAVDFILRKSMGG